MRGAIVHLPIVRHFFGQCSPREERQNVRLHCCSYEKNNTRDYFLKSETPFPAIILSVRLLGLDIGNSRTGVAYFEDDIGIVLPVTTITAKETKALVAEIIAIAQTRKVDQLVIGVPRLPSGEEGEQARQVRIVGDLLAVSYPVSYIDERYTSVPLREKGQKPKATSDSDTWAACQILLMYTERKNHI